MVCFVWTMCSKLFLFGFSRKENCWILFKVRGLQWHSATRIKLSVADFFFFFKLDYCISFGQRCRLGFMSVPTVLLIIIDKQLLEIMSILLWERITSCWLSFVHLRSIQPETISVAWHLYQGRLWPRWRVLLAGHYRCHWPRNSHGFFISLYNLPSITGRSGWCV